MTSPEGLRHLDELVSVERIEGTGQMSIRVRVCRIEPSNIRGVCVSKFEVVEINFGCRDAKALCSAVEEQRWFSKLVRRIGIPSV